MPNRTISLPDDVVPLTSNLDRAGLAGNVLLAAATTGLPRDSVAVPLGLELVDRSWSAERVGQLPDVGEPVERLVALPPVQRDRWSRTSSIRSQSGCPASSRVLVRLFAALTPRDTC